MNLKQRSRALSPAWIIATLKSLAAPAVAIVIAVFLQLVIKPMLGEFYPNGGEFYAKVLLDIGTNVILAVSLTMVNGFTGQFSMGHAAFMAIGGYVAAALVYYGSAHAFKTPDFSDPRSQGGALSTMLTTREIDVAGGKLLAEGSTAVFIPEEDVSLTKNRTYRLRSGEDSDQKLAFITITAPAGDYATDARIATAAPSSHALAGTDVRLMLAPRFFSPGDGIFLLSILAGGIGAAVCGYLVGLPSLRLRGDYLAIVTLGFGEIVRVLIQAKTGPVIHSVDKINSSSIGTLATSLGQSLGFSKLPSYASLFWVWLFACITLIVAFRLKRSSFGRAFLSIREDEIAAEAMGINTTRYKVRAFVIAAFFAGVAGGLFAHTSGVQLNAGELGFQKSFDIIILVVLGGLGSISGAAIAAILLTILPELLREPPSLWYEGVIGAVVLATLMSAFSRDKRKPFLVIGGLCIGWELLRFGARAADVTLADYRMVLYALVLILMMILRPQGLMGVGEIWDLRLGGRTHASRKSGKGPSR